MTTPSPSASRTFNVHAVLWRRPVWLLALALSACGSLPDKPVRPAMYDFGPGPLAASAAGNRQTLPPLALGEVETTGGALDNVSVLYRLGYADSQQLRPYSQARWSMPAAQLVRQRLREVLGQERVVFRAGEGPALTRVQGVLPMMLRLELQEFSHFFETPANSFGLLRMRASLLENTPTGERLLGQRDVVIRQPALSADAAGGVRALTEASDAAAIDIAAWLRQTPRN